MSVRRTSLEHGIKRHAPSGARGAFSLEQKSPTERVLKRARELGFVRASVVSLEAFDEPVTRLEAFFNQGRAGNMDYLMHRQDDGKLTRADPRALLPDAECAVVVALPYPLSSPAAHGVAGYAQGEDYHIAVKEKLLCLADEVADALGHDVLARACVDSAPILERDLALRAGFVFLGKNTLTIAPGAGSHFLLGELLLQATLEPSTVRVAPGCGSCRACLDACPTGAFVGPYELDATKCVSYLTIESSADMPRELRRGVGTHLFGCDDCQTVCPYNVSAPSRASAPELQPRQAVLDLNPEAVLKMGSSDYKRLVRGSALRRASRNQLARNAAVALGNAGDAASVPLLYEQAKAHSSAQVREHCTFALGALLHDHGVEAARPALLVLAEGEDEAVRQEALLCLDLEAFEEASGSHPTTDTH